METPPSATASEAMRAVRRASGLIEARTARPHRALEVLAPYMACDRFVGVSEGGSTLIAHLVASVVGDCYREEGNVAEAARWYRRASDFRRDGGYVHLYVDMVIQHRLADRYEHALECLRYGRLAWKRTALWLRALGHILTWWQLLRRPWNIREYLRVRRCAKTFEATLLALLADGASAAPACTHAQGARGEPQCQARRRPSRADDDAEQHR